MATDADPLLSAKDIQGNLLPGFNRKERYLVAYSSTDGAALAAVLAFLRAKLTTMAQALEHRDERKRAFQRNGPAPVRRELWLNLALGPNAVVSIGASAVMNLDDSVGSFASGMRPGLVGDAFAPKLADGSDNPASRANWVAGSPSKPIELLLIFANDGGIEEAAAPVVSEVSRLLNAQPVYQEAGRLLPGETEHFGFRDGISQVGVRGRIAIDGAERLITTRYGVPSMDGVDFGKPGQPLVWPGQFLTGQPSGPEDVPDLPLELTNGSFLVFRRLRQDVRAFYEDTNTLAATLGNPGGGADLRNRIVGRLPSGAALMRHENEPAEAEGPNEINYFAFGTPLPSLHLADGSAVSESFADPDVLRGRRCPVWAHIRKVNPRDQGTDQGGPVDTTGFQMLRRGIPFGPAYDHGNPQKTVNAAERGLLFLSYQRSLARQFGLLNRQWMNNRDAPQAGGFDLLVGQKVPDETGLHAPKSATFFAPGGGGAGTDFEAQRQWVVPTGGAFLFAPSIAFVEKFAAAFPSIT